MFRLPASSGNNQTHHHDPPIALTHGHREGYASQPPTQTQLAIINRVRALSAIRLYATTRCNESLVTTAHSYASAQFLFLFSVHICVSSFNVLKTMTVKLFITKYSRKREREREREREGTGVGKKGNIDLPCIDRALLPKWAEGLQPLACISICIAWIVSRSKKEEKKKKQLWIVIGEKMRQMCDVLSLAVGAGCRYSPSCMLSLWIAFYDLKSV